MKIIKCQFRYWELCWILEAIDDLLHESSMKRSSRCNEISRVRAHVIRLMQRMEDGNDNKGI